MDTNAAIPNLTSPSTAKATNSTTTTVSAPIPPTFDLGSLLVLSPSPLPPNPTNDTLALTARTCAQSLISQLLLTCPIHTTPTSVSLTLPPPTTPLPREKPLPLPKEATKWEKFAKKKGIKDKKRGEGGGKMVYNEEKGTWVPKWGYKGRNKEGEGEWIVEVDEKKNGEKEGEGVRGQGRRERVEKMRRGERKQRNNEKRARKGGSGAG